MVELTEVFKGAHFLVSEANGHRSRKQGTLLSGQDLQAGAVLGMVEVGSASAQAKAGNTGNGTMGAVTVGAGAKDGVYTLTIIEPATDAGTFVVEDPDGINVGNGDVGAAFNGGGLSFTLADGATDFAAGDQFLITVATGSGKYREYNPDGTDGAEDPAGILYEAVDASGGDKACVVFVRDCVVNKNELVWGAGVDSSEQAAALLRMENELGIVARNSSEI